MAVTELGYLGIGVKSLAQWREFASEILGMEVVDEGEPGRCYLRMDYWHHRLIVDEDGTDDVTVLGLRVAGAEEFLEMQKRLSDAGVPHQVGSRQEADDRRVLELMRLQDPGGNPLEIFHGPLVQFDKPFHPGRRMHGRFKTGAGGLGHCILRHGGLDATYRFYRALGMRGGIEYRIPIPGGSRMELLFMHCNERDHTVAFGIPGPKRINHLMIEFDNLDDVGLTYEIVRRRGLPVAILPGKHANDHMYSFYFVNPSGWMCEIGWGARAATHQSEYYERDTYGHEFQRDVVGGDKDPASAKSRA
jgi:2,3-dihydroxyethylbenzene 1,2-dioxygenase